MRTYREQFCGSIQIPFNENYLVALNSALLGYHLIGGHMRCLMIVLMAVWVSGCTSGYKQFYRPLSGAPVPDPLNSEPITASSTGNTETDILRMFEAGYVLIGSSNFVGPLEDTSAAVRQAKSVNAARVVVGGRYQSTAQGSMPITTPTTTTAYTTGTANIYGGGMPTYGTYSGTTTYYGTQTSYVPYSVDRYEQFALFFSPAPPRILGALMAPMTDAMKQAVGSNKGVAIRAVMNRSPAYQADLNPGDVILSIDGTETVDIPTAQNLIRQKIGEDMDLQIFRSGKSFSKHVLVPAT